MFGDLSDWFGTGPTMTTSLSSILLQSYARLESAKRWGKAFVGVGVRVECLIIRFGS